MHGNEHDIPRNLMRARTVAGKEVASTAAAKALVEKAKAMPWDTGAATRQSTAIPRAGGWLHRLRIRLAAVLGTGLITAVPAAATAQAVPQHWISYAQLTGNQLQERLSDGEEQAVVRLHGWLQDRVLATQDAAPPAPVVVRIWVGGSGKVSRAEFDSLGNAQADEDLRMLLTSTELTEPPPGDMRQPMVLRLRLDAAPVPQTDDGAVSKRAAPQ